MLTVLPLASLALVACAKSAWPFFPNFAGSFDDGPVTTPDGTTFVVGFDGDYNRVQPYLGCIGNCDHKLYAVAPDGAAMWNVSLGRVGGYYEGDRGLQLRLSRDGHTLYVAAYWSPPREASWQLSAHRTADGSRRWMVPTSSMVPALGADGRLYVVTAAGELACLDPASGEPIWTNGRTKKWACGGPALVGGALYVTIGRSIASFNATDGAFLWGKLVGPKYCDSAGWAHEVPCYDRSGKNVWNTTCEEVAASPKERVPEWYNKTAHDANESLPSWCFDDKGQHGPHWAPVWEARGRRDNMNTLDNKGQCKLACGTCQVGGTTMEMCPEGGDWMACDAATCPDCECAPSYTQIVPISLPADVDAHTIAVSTLWGMPLPPLTKDVTSPYSIHALSRHDGEAVWTWDLPCPGQDCQRDCSDTRCPHLGPPSVFGTAIPERRLYVLAQTARQCDVPCNTIAARSYPIHSLIALDVPLEDEMAAGKGPTVAWQYDMDGSIDVDCEKPVITRDGTVLVVAEHAIDGLFEGGLSNLRLHAVARDGTRRWVYGAGRKNQSTVAYNGCCTSLSPDGSVVYVTTGYWGSDSYLVALRMEDGKPAVTALEATVPTTIATATTEASEAPVLFEVATELPKKAQYDVQPAYPPGMGASEVKEATTMDAPSVVLCGLMVATLSIAAAWALATRRQRNAHTQERLLCDA